MTRDLHTTCLIIAIAMLGLANSLMLVCNPPPGRLISFAVFSQSQVGIAP